MERCRWLPNQTYEKYIVVNIPDYTLFAYKQDSTGFSCKVVVGKETNKTAIFRGDMKYVVFNPYWNVPESIIKKEILPEIKKNSRYLEEHEMEWNGGKIRQKPGAQNALGKVKFLFPNVFNIYLHDTPAKTLFSKEKRTFSHGCIRVAEPRKLAVFLLEDEPGWTEEAIDRNMEYGKERYVTLKKPIPVYVVYFTAFVDDLGRLNFRKDIYLRDHPLRDIILSK
jgi:murein L,D-transpeptidase YcbB/YkuD